MVPATTASADSTTTRTEVRDVAIKDLNCAETVAKYHDTGTVNMYNGSNCKGSAMCKDTDNDSNYATGGACKGSDNDATTSIANLAWNTVNDDVRFYRHAGYKVFIDCVKRGQYRSSGGDYNNVISSHKWANC